MTFYGPTFPNETRNETLLNGRQRFGNRSANMFFVRPARHIACPRSLKYIHDIKTGYIPYVEDSEYPNRPSYKNILQKMNDDDVMNKTNSLGLYNSSDAWRQELMELAQQVKTSLIPNDEQEQYFRQSRSSLSNKNRQTRSGSILSNYSLEENDEQNVSKQVIHARASPRYPRSKVPKSKTTNDKSVQEQSSNDENQDPGIWLIPILCYILQIDNIFEAQDWLVNANPTEKRLAMELISRTMQDMQNHDSDHLSDASTSDLPPLTTHSPNLNNVYWPYKIWQRQEKDRQQQQIQNFVKHSKLPAYPLLPSLTVDNAETCERATSPLRIFTPAKRSPPSPTTNNISNPVETTVIERSPTRNTTDRATPSVVIRRNQTPKTDRPATIEKRPPSRIVTPIIMNGNDRPSRRSYRVTTSLNNCTNEDTNPVPPTLRGKTPLI